MVVRKIAGNTETMPASNEDSVLSPEEINTHSPIAEAAKRPRASRAVAETLCLPLGAGGLRIHAAMPTITMATVANSPTSRPGIPDDFIAVIAQTLPAARMHHKLSVIVIRQSSLSF